MTGGGISRRRFVRDGATLAVGTALGVPAATRAQPGAADVVLRGGRVLTMRGKGEAEAVAVSAGRIAYVGSNSGAAAYAGPGTEVIDLRGRTLMPGIHDGHSHPLSGGLVLTEPTLNYRKLDLKPFLAALRKLLARSSEQEPDGWLSVDLWEPSGMDRQPTKKDLDRLHTRRPILVIDYSGHTAVANSRALEIAGISASTPNPPGGKIERGPRREPTGVLQDNAIGLVFEKVPPLTTAQNADALQVAHEEMAKQGITSYLDASVSHTELAALAALSDRGPLTIRPSVAINVGARAGGRARGDARPSRAAAREVRASRGHDPDGEDVLRRRDRIPDPDGRTAHALPGQQGHEAPSALGGRKEPWSDLLPASRGQPRDRRSGRGGLAGAHPRHRRPRGALSARRIRSRARQRGRQPPHDHPPRAGEPARLPPLRGARGPREHAAALGRARLLHGRRAQAVHRPPALALHVPGRQPRAGRRRLCGGSDWPVDPLLPFRQIEIAVNRTADEVYEGYRKPLFAQEGLSLRASLAMHTRNSAYQLHQENLTGQIRQGYAADLIVLDRDLLRVPLKRVSKTKVDLTMVGGRVVHRA